jgi:2-oxoglutarate ferredoxin oxidoreductase subunit beta
MQLRVEHGRPLLFGKERRKGLRLKPGSLEVEVVTLGECGVKEEDVLVHDETNRSLASLLISLQPPAFPVAIGVLYCDPVSSYGEDLERQLAEAGARPATEADLDEMLRGGRTWEVEG